MRIRHKQPTLVSMWMLDVFCCALGCVTLLFLLNSRLATDAARASRDARADLAHTDQQLATALAALETTRTKLATEEAERGKLTASLAELEGARLKLVDESRALTEDLKLARTEKDEAGRKLDTARDELKTARTLLDSTRESLAGLEKKATATAKELADARAEAATADRLLKARQTDIDELAKKDAARATQLDGLRRSMLSKDAERSALDAQLAEARKELAELDAKLRATRRELDAQIAATKAGAAKTGEELGTARAQIKDLNKKVDDANATIIDLQGEKAKLADKYDRFQKEAETRFAGVAMTGKRVVFLVDMSGSMGKRDLQTLDGTKWPLVVETVCKVMRSISTLERYQVVVFSSSARWLFDDGEWCSFDGEKSVVRVRDALLKTKPVDDTNMYAAFEKAFGLKTSGLDTMYLFSDGLPTSGPGLTREQEKANPPLSESELGVILGKHVRDTLACTWNKPAAGQSRVRINAIGFYFESVEVGAFLWSLARDNDGSFVGMSKP
ncbi:Chromosome partition protein Smc [Gemmata obscuriglobus]|uniref:VWA domain-containing protein n=1 Tax=Gemmata obscuriglobus TaxID=114 RepID=A0A2Z3H4U6_9BACT|nr:vWA domain-containing protein [Gemmata obscuriglobus]AWM40788.1 VWA domain-containing protein [Gemmata obscuriglobus]QEG25930.1 Chromosome partition protein Smc [Gemmata obscuriglobus]VTS00070.1 von Willebrand factor type A-like protein OS=gamma proteobacterium HIMB55 GN=OMB55_00000690 PE=4 SV=1: VWA_2 [Gemmata obscuriglobus UQM 2246]